MSSTEQLTARLSYLEQIIIIIITGGLIPPRPPKGDPFATDTTRLEALLRRGAGGFPFPPGDPFASDVARLSLEDVESETNEVAASIVRLQARQGELAARLKELRAKPR